MENIPRGRSGAHHVMIRFGLVNVFAAANGPVHPRLRKRAVFAWSIDVDGNVGSIRVDYGVFMFTNCTAPSCRNGHF